MFGGCVVQRARTNLAVRSVRNEIRGVQSRTLLLIFRLNHRPIHIEGPGGREACCQPAMVDGLCAASSGRTAVLRARLHLQICKECAPGQLLPLTQLTNRNSHSPKRKREDGQVDGKMNRQSRTDRKRDRRTIRDRQTDG